MRHIVPILTLLVMLPLLAEAGNGVPKRSVILAGLDVDSMRVRLDETDAQPLEGIWYYPNEEMTLGIERYRGEHNIGYRIILLESPDINVMPGTVIGYIASSAVDNKYQLWLYSQRDNAFRSRYHVFNRPGHFMRAFIIYTVIVRRYKLYVLIQRILDYDIRVRGLIVLVADFVGDLPHARTCARPACPSPSLSPPTASCPTVCSRWILMQ